MFGGVFRGLNTCCRRIMDDNDNLAITITYKRGVKEYLYLRNH